MPLSGYACVERSSRFHQTKNRCQHVIFLTLFSFFLYWSYKMFLIHSIEIYLNVSHKKVWAGHFL